MVCQGDLTRSREAATTGQGTGGNGVVGRPEGAAGDQGMCAVGEAADRPQLGGLQRLLPGQVGEDGGQAFGQHTLACTGRAYHEDVVSAGGGDF